MSVVLLLLVLGSVLRGRDEGMKMDNASTSSICDVQRERCAPRRARNGDLERLAHGWLWRRRHAEYWLAPEVGKSGRVKGVKVWFPQSRRVEATEETGLHARMRIYILICVTCTSSPSPRSVPSIHVLTLLLDVNALCVQLDGIVVFDSR